MTTDPAGRVDIADRLWSSDVASALTNEAAREIERLRTALGTIAATVTDPSVMQKWDLWRRYIAGGGTASYPRDEFEALIDSIATEAKDALAPAESK